MKQTNSSTNQESFLAISSEFYQGYSVSIFSEGDRHFAVLEMQDFESTGQIRLDRNFKSAKSAQSFARHYIDKSNLCVNITELVDGLMSGQLKTQNCGKLYVQFLHRLRQLEEMNWDDQE